MKLPFSSISHFSLFPKYINLVQVVGHKWNKRSTNQGTNNRQASWGSTAWSRCRCSCTLCRCGSWWALMMMVISQHCTKWGSGEEHSTSDLLHLHCGEAWPARNSDTDLKSFHRLMPLEFAACSMSWGCEPYIGRGLSFFWNERLWLFNFLAFYF